VADRAAIWEEVWAVQCVGEWVEAEDGGAAGADRADGMAQVVLDGTGQVVGMVVVREAGDPGEVVGMETTVGHPGAVGGVGTAEGRTAVVGRGMQALVPLMEAVGVGWGVMLAAAGGKMVGGGDHVVAVVDAAGAGIAITKTSAIITPQGPRRVAVRAEDEGGVGVAAKEAGVGAKEGLRQVVGLTKQVPAAPVGARGQVLEALLVGATVHQRGAALEAEELLSVLRENRKSKNVRGKICVQNPRAICWILLSQMVLDA
jgi:hypothetical protein